MTQLDPSNIKAWLLLAQSNRNRSWSKARNAFQKVLQLDPDNGEAHFGLGGAIAKSPEERVHHLRRAAQLMPDHKWVHGVLALVLLLHGNVQEAVTEMKLQIDLNPSVFGVLARFVELLRERGRTAEAREIYVAYLGSDELQRSKCEGFPGMPVEQFREQPDVVNIFKEECEGYAYHALARLERDPFEKIHLLQKAVELTPEHMSAHGELAKLLLEYEDNVEDAVREMKEQIARNSVATRKDILAFARTLRERSETEQEVAVLTAYLREGLLQPGAPGACEWVVSLDLEQYESYQDFLSLVKKAVEKCEQKGAGRG